MPASLGFVVFYFGGLNHILYIFLFDRFYVCNFEVFLVKQS